MSCGVGRRRSLDLALLCLWPSPAATALIQPLAWEPPYVLDCSPKKTKKTKKKKKIGFPGLIYACYKIDKELEWNLPDW